MAIKGVFVSSLITIAASWIIKSLGLISTIILARLLTPEDFGSVAICMLVIYFFDLLATTGTRAYILSLKEVTNEDINSAWTLDFCAKLFIAIVVVMASSYIASNFGNEELALAIATSAFIPFLHGIGNPKLNLLRRELAYIIIFRIEVFAKIISFIVTISLAYYFRSYWALIFGSLTSALVLTLLGYLLYPYKPTFTLCRYKEQWAFSKWIFFKAFLGYARAKTDTYILAKYFSLANIGLFNIAKELGMLVYEQIGLPVGDIVVSGIKKAGEDLGQIRETIEFYFIASIFITLPASVGVFVLSDDLVLLLLGEQWSEAGKLLKPLAILGFIVAATSILTASMNALRKVKATFYLECLTASAAVIILYSQRELELYPFSQVVALTGGVTLSLYLAITYYYVKISFYNIAIALTPIGLSSYFMYESVLYIKELEQNVHVISLFQNILVGVLSYGFSIVLLLYCIKYNNGPINNLKRQGENFYRRILS